MKSHTTSETEVWLENEGKLYRVSDKREESIGFSSKRTVSITVFDQPMKESLEAVKRQMVMPFANKKTNVAREIFQTLQSLQNQLNHVIQ